MASQADNKMDDTQRTSDNNIESNNENSVVEPQKSARAPNEGEEEEVSEYSGNKINSSKDIVNNVDENESTKNDLDDETKVISSNEPKSMESGVSISTSNEHGSVVNCQESSSLPSRISIKQDDDLEKLHLLCMKLNENQDSSTVQDTIRSQTTDSILQLLVTDDLSNIRNVEVLKAFFIEYLQILPSKVISEILSVLIAIVKKSVFHLESARGLLFYCINYLMSDLSKCPKTDTTKQSQSESASSLSLTKHFLREWVNLLIAHSCDVEELKLILKLSEHDPSLLNFLQQANIKQRNRPYAFFAFPGSKGSMMSLPPFQKWPIQLGWSFSTWFFLEPKACAQPYLYNFKTGKSGLGYSAHFTGNCLVLTSIRVKGKGVQHCVAYEFPSYKWTHCAVTYHNKWRASEVKVYVNGQLSANIEMPWQVQTTELFDKCFIGGSGSITSKDRSGDLNCFCGRMSAIYLFNEGLSPAQICALHRLGPSYMGQFKYSNESHVNLPPQICKALYEEKLSSTLFCLFTPIAVDSGTLCIQLAPFRSSTSASAQNYFISAPHAALLGQTKAIITQSICSTLQSLGCSRSLLPLLDAFASKGNPEACASLVGFLCDILESSPHWFANEIVQNNGFVMVACALANNSKILLSESLLNIILNLTKTLLTTSSAGDSLLLKHLMDNILFNPSLWIYADAKLQIKLYSYLANEFLHGTTHGSNRYTISNSSGSNVAYGRTSVVSTGLYNNQTGALNAGADDQHRSGIHESSSSIGAFFLFAEIRRVSTVLQSLHALKYYYWMVEEKGVNYKARDHNLRPNQSQLAIIRSHILSFTRGLIGRSNTIPLDEIQGLLNYLSACSQPENLIDVLDTLSSLITEHPTSMVAALDHKQGIKVIITLIGYKGEELRIRALRLLSLFLAQCSHKKKQELMGPHNLFMLLCDRLRIYRPMTLGVYEALIDLLIEENNPDRALDSKRSRELSKKRIENSMVIKVIASLLHDEMIDKSKIDTNQLNKNSKEESSGPHEDIRKIFINDLWNMIVNSRENRRIILQMSVWQHWLINLINSTIEDSPLVRDQILAIFRVLLYHAIRYEYGGWRVWIDTLAIIHAKVSYDEFCQQVNADISQTTNQQQDTTESKRNKELEASRLAPKKLNTSSSNTVESDDTKNISTLENGDPNDSKQTIVSSISEHIPNQSRGIEIAEEQQQEGQNKVDEKHAIDDEKEASKKGEAEDVDSANVEPNDENTKTNHDDSIDSVDIAPSRAYRKMSLNDEPDERGPSDANNDNDTSEPREITRQTSLTSITLEDPPIAHDGTVGEDKLDEDNEVKIEETNNDSATGSKHATNYQPTNNTSEPHSFQSQKATASPAFRIPEFRWCNILIKLLNDLIFSVECDLYYWRCSANVPSIDAAPFVPKSAGVLANQSSSSNANSKSSSSSTNQIESILQKPENQTYLINVVHLVSQLADNVIIAAGGLLPLLADATGGARGSSPSPSPDLKTTITCEGLTVSQANSLLYRLVSIVDVVVFAASHINLGELEADKNTTSGGILRQCLRLACTVTVKNCLVLRGLINKIGSMGIGGELSISNVEFPKDMFDSYQGCSLLSVNGLFEDSALTLDNTDLIVDVDYSPHQTPNAGPAPPFLPFQTTPIKDPNKLLQGIDILRIQASIYHNASTESRQSQFLALSSLYFISVLMVSKYRDIIEPKHKGHKTKSPSSGNDSTGLSADQSGSSTSVTNESQNGTDSVSTIEANLLSFGKMQPTSPSPATNTTTMTNTLTNMLTTKLENTLDTVCPLLKSIMCDFCAFLSKTLVGSHGQDLVNREAERTFRRADASPVELVMLLCSQEWQNTLQKNAGLAFIELINEGRVLSHGMKDHIVRVAMEAEFILSRLRADDVAKHEHFGLACSETLSARIHEEVLINSLISSAARRDYVLYCKFREAIRNESRRDYKLDIWEDDDRRKRRFVFDSWDNSTQQFYSSSTQASGESDTTATAHDSKTDTKRILELQKTIEMGGINADSCAAGGGNHQPDTSVGKEDDESDYEMHDDAEYPQNHESNSPDSDVEYRSQGRHTKDGVFLGPTNETSQDKQTRAHHHNYPTVSKNKTKDSAQSDGLNENDMKTNQPWDYDDCDSVNDFTGSVVFAAECSLIWAIYAIPGLLQLTTYELYFEPNQNISEAIDALKRETKDGDQADDETCLRSIKSTQHESLLPSEQINLRKIDLKSLRYCDFLTCNGKIQLNDIKAIFSRHYLLQPNALEIFLSQRTSVMFAFSDFDTVKRVVKYLPPVGVGIKYGIPQTRRASLMSPRQLFAASNMTQKWQKREIGNFQYLMFLNTIAGRTYQDFNQYPVFPWILTNYESEELDLNLPTNFRDLSKPIGALNNKRRADFIERYQTWDNPKVPAFHYGTHYSTAAFALNWLCRLRGAYNSSYLALQDSKYEEETRLFLSIGDSWVSSLIGGQQNVKELIPEFFYLPEMFHSNLGLPEVEYPPWARSAEQFVRMHRIALESELVSCQLHQWIDLIFGYKQRGPEAINAVNTFYYLTYQGNVNLNMIQDLALRDAIETQIKHFGQTPSQLTTEPHPPRFSALHVAPLIFSSSVDEVNKVIKFPFNTPVVHISSCINNYISSSAVSLADGSSTGTVPQPNSANSPSSVLTITSNNQYQIHKWVLNDQSGHPFTIDPQLESQASGSSGSNSSNRRQLVDVDDLCSGILLKLQSFNTTQHIVDEVQWPCGHYIVTLNGRYIIMGSFYDNSFRVFTTESGKLCQVIYGHRGPITCIARSEGNAAADFYIATGSQDCSLLIWAWNERYAQVEGNGVSAVHNPLPKLSITGHQTPVLSAMICAELGLILSGSKNLILVHTTNSGENLLRIDVKLPDILDKTLHETRNFATTSGAGPGQHSAGSFGAEQPVLNILRPQVKDKEKTVLEASMLGQDGPVPSRTKRPSPANKDTNNAITPTTSTNDKTESTSSRSQSPAFRSSERFMQLKDLCCSDYYITNIQLARELAFIVCVALPPPRKKSKGAPSSSSLEHDSSSTLTSISAANNNSSKSSPALLLTFNLKGSLMDSTPIGQSVNGPKLGDVCVLQTSRDGEHLILNDSPITIKIYKTFGLQPIYAYNTNDIPNALGATEDQNRIRSLALLDHKYILVGLENGKIIVYNSDFKNLH